MGLLGKIIGGVATEPIEAIGNVAESIFGSKDRKLTHAEFMAELAAKPSLAQTEINKVEAGHRSIFVAGWRPAIGWVGAAALAYAFLIDPVLDRFGTVGPDLPMDYIMEIVLGMLGLGALRTVEKLQGKAK